MQRLQKRNVQEAQEMNPVSVTLYAMSDEGFDSLLKLRIKLKKRKKKTKIDWNYKIIALVNETI